MVERGGLPVEYRKDPPFLVNVSFSDVLTNTSYLTLYCSAAFPKSTTYESYTTNDDGEATVGSSTTPFCQTFTVGNTGTDENFWVNGCEIYANANANDNTITAEIQETTDGKPNGTILAKGTTKGNLIGDGTNRWIRIGFDYGTELLASTKYALVLYAGAGLVFDWRYDGSAPSYTGGSYGNYAGAAWTMDTDKDFLFKVLGDTKPFLTFFVEDLQNADSTSIEGAAESRSYVQVIESSIDYLVKYPIRLNGNAIISCPLNVTAVLSDYFSYYFDFEIFRVTGGVETSLGTGSSKARNISAIEDVDLLSLINIDNEQIKVNDSIRLNIKLYAHNSAAGGGDDITIEWKDIVLKLPIKTPN